MGLKYPKVSDDKMKRLAEARAKLEGNNAADE
jgi:hypothetical protein